MVESSLVRFVCLAGVRMGVSNEMFFRGLNEPSTTIMHVMEFDASVSQEESSGVADARCGRNGVGQQTLEKHPQLFETTHGLKPVWKEDRGVAVLRFGNGEYFKCCICD